MGNYNYSYPKNRLIGKMLRHGDKRDVAELTNYSYPYVIEVLSGKRTNELILSVAKTIADKRTSIKSELKKLL
jgi:hypothetical protein